MEETGFEDRVVLAVVDALAHTISYWVRGVAIDVDEDDGTAAVMFACPVDPGDVRDGIAEFSARLDAAASSWLRHSTELWITPILDDWPGNDRRVVFATRVPPPDRGVGPEAEFQNDAVLLITAAIGASFGPELWGVSFASDAATRSVDISLAFSRPPDRQDRYEIEEFETTLSSFRTDVFWQTSVWVGALAELHDWPGYGDRRVALQRPPNVVVPDDFD